MSYHLFTLVGSAGLAGSHGDAEDGVRSELVLVLGAVELDHQVVEGSLVNGVHLGGHDGGGDDLLTHETAFYQVCQCYEILLC